MQRGGLVGVLLSVICAWTFGCGARPTPLPSAAPTSDAHGRESAANALAPQPKPSGSALAPEGTPAPPRAEAPEALAYPRFELGGTLVRDLDSELTGKRHQLLIGLPDSFRKDPARRYPVLLVLDGQWDFALVNALAGGLRYDEVAPEMLIVGLSYGGESPDYGALRSHDYVPTRARNRSGTEAGGGAPSFLTWIEKSVLPLLEQDYRADPERRIIAGASFGGLFVLYSLFERPDLFWAYIAISPAVGWDDRYIFRREREFRAAHPSLSRRVWLSSGSREWPDYLRDERAFFKQFSASGYREISLAVRDIEGERHAGVKPEAYNRALRFVSEPLVSKPE